MGSIHTREVSAHDVVRILQRDGRPTDLGDAVAHYGRIFKTLHVLTFVDDPAYRQEMKAMRNLQEGRHAMARHIFHGRVGKLHRRRSRIAMGRLRRRAPRPTNRSRDSDTARIQTT
ncbi:UNVERIFIED_ORG: TnpA family transposase [Arthrobacter sp. UYCu721]